MFYPTFVFSCFDCLGMFLVRMYTYIIYTYNFYIQGISGLNHNNSLGTGGAINMREFEPFEHIFLCRMQHSIQIHPVKHVAAFLYGSVGVFQRVAL